MHSDPQTRAREMVVEVDHTRIGPMKTLGLPLKSSGELTSIRKPAPLLGQHSREILRDLGYSESAADGLIEAGVVREARAG